MSRLTDDDVAELIKELPRTEASDGFTGRVLQKLDDALARRARLRAGLAVAVIVLVAGGAAWMAERYERSRAAERLEALRSEYRELESELEKLRALAAEIEPVLELGGTDEVDFIFDLRDVDAGHVPRQGRGQPSAQPVSHERRR